MTDIEQLHDLLDHSEAEIERLVSCASQQGADLGRLMTENKRLRAALQQIVERYETAEDGWPAEDMRTIARHALEPKP